MITELQIRTLRDHADPEVAQAAHHAVDARAESAACQRRRAEGTVDADEALARERACTIASAAMAYHESKLRKLIAAREGV